MQAVAIQAEEAGFLRTQPERERKGSVFVVAVISSLTLICQAESITISDTPTVIHFMAIIFF